MLTWFASQSAAPAGTGAELAKGDVFSDLQFGCERIRNNTLVPGGRPQMVSLIPFRKRLLKTESPNQLVVMRFVEYSGFTLQPFVPVERSTTLLLTARLRM